ncbi:Ti-type conjugative transfer system protein TraG [Rhizobium leguminosarum]|uniref:Ti-type conjugative transfer system protein TraG n=1 Tax=Rhizobium leguminosarum TaxID=384 RepID=UPI000ACC231B|nr:Ti-type conjugative transfer system protein TraG [Rhizobium leguminosarum]
MLDAALIKECADPSLKPAIVEQFVMAAGSDDPLAVTVKSGGRLILVPKARTADEAMAIVRQYAGQAVVRVGLTQFPAGVGVKEATDLKPDLVDPCQNLRRGTAMFAKVLRIVAKWYGNPTSKDVFPQIFEDAIYAWKTGEFEGVSVFQAKDPGGAPANQKEPRADKSEAEAAKLFPDAGGIVIGERYRVDKDNVGSQAFRADSAETWGAGGKSPLLCFDGSFGSSHGIVFAGSGGFKTTSVTIPTALKWGSTLIVLDPSNEVAPMVSAHRGGAGRDVFVLDPRKPELGFNVLDWIGRFGGTKEEDIASVASWIMSDSGGERGVRDDFFRASALQLLTALIADVCLSGHTDEKDQTLRQVRMNLSEPEPTLRKRLQDIYDNSGSDFVKENVAAFVNMTPETFSGVYANAVKETHWLSYPNYAALVSGKKFSTSEIAAGNTDVFINIDLKTLETHAGLARVIIGSFLNAIYNRDGQIKGRALFLLDEVARLGYMRIIETARDAGRKYGITLTMIYQSIGQMRETYGGRDAASKWFESASWISFAAINDPETAAYISRRCGMTTVEIDQVSRSFQSKGSSRTRSKQLAARPLIQPHEVLRMRADEQIVFTAGNAPLRCGRAIWFRRDDMRACAGKNRFHQTASHEAES